VTALQHEFAAALREGGSDTLFGLVGGGNFALAGSFLDHGGCYVGLRHEMNAVAAADSYARTTLRTGLVTVTQGPGLTHTLTALVEAAKSGSPLLVLAADTPLGDRVSNQSLDQAAVAAAAGAGYVRWRRPAEPAAFIQEATRRAREERRPILVGFPQDFSTDPSDAPTAPVTVQRAESAHLPTEAEITEAVRLLILAERPVVLAGRGAHLANAAKDLVWIAEHIGATLATTVMAEGLFSAHPQSAGISGGFGDDHSARLLAGADVILAVGASLNGWTTRHGELYGDATVIHVDDREAAIGRYTPVSLGLVGDAATVAAALRRRLTAATGPRTGRAAGVAAALQARDPVSLPERAPDGRLDPRSLTAALDGILPAERCVTVDGGHFSGWPVMYLSAQSPESLLYPHGFQSVGLGLGSVVGIARARPDRLPVLAVGDGGLLMSLGELDTLLSEHIPALVVVYDDSAYGAELHAFRGDPNIGLARLPGQDFAAIFRAMGGQAVKVSALDDLDGIRPWLAVPSGPMLLHCTVSREVLAPWLRFAFSRERPARLYRAQHRPPGGRVIMSRRGQRFGIPSCAQRPGQSAHWPQAVSRQRRPADPPRPAFSGPGEYGTARR
jgi:acetolactate synthase I/II/III large subunit